MLDIPTVRANRQARRAQPTTAVGGSLGGPSIAEQPSTTAGVTSMTPAPMTALSKTTPYEYANTPWNDPVAQSTMKSWYEDPSHGFAGVNAWNPGGGTGFFERSLANAKAYDASPGVYHSEIDPARFTPEQKESYIGGGGTYYDQFTPAQQSGLPYFAATGEAAPVMNMATGVAETPTFGAGGKVTGQTPATVGGTGSFHTLAPEVLSKMWR